MNGNRTLSGPSDYSGSTSENGELYTFNNRKQNTGESVEVYGADLTYKGHQIGKEDMELMHAFTTGLLPHIRS